jgi:hypothetical protein
MNPNSAEFRSAVLPARLGSYSHALDGDAVNPSHLTVKLTTLLLQ